MAEDNKKKPVYEKPVVMPLTGISKGMGTVCAHGSRANPRCNMGSIATGQCTDGSAAVGQCNAGSGFVIPSCKIGVLAVSCSYGAGGGT